MLFTVSTLAAKSPQKILSTSPNSVNFVTPSSVHLQEQKNNENVENVPSFFLSSVENSKSKSSSINDSDISFYSPHPLSKHAVYTDPLLQRIDLLKRANRLLTLSQSRSISLSRKEKNKVLSELLQTCREQTRHQRLDWIIDEQVDELKKQWNEKEMSQQLDIVPKTTKTSIAPVHWKSRLAHQQASVSDFATIEVEKKRQNKQAVKKEKDENKNKNKNKVKHTPHPSASLPIQNEAPIEEKTCVNSPSDPDSPKFNVPNSPLSYLQKRVERILSKKKANHNFKTPKVSPISSRRHPQPLLNSTARDTRFVASPVPPSTLLPRYQQLVNQKNTQKQQLHSKHIERLCATLKPFQFAYSTFLKQRREEKKAKLAQASLSSKPQKPIPVFRLAQSAALEGKKRFLQRQGAPQQPLGKEYTFHPKINSPCFHFSAPKPRLTLSTCMLSSRVHEIIKKKLRSPLHSCKEHLDRAKLPSPGSANSTICSVQRTPPNRKSRIRVRIHWTETPKGSAS